MALLLLQMQFFPILPCAGIGDRMTSGHFALQTLETMPQPPTVLPPPPDISPPHTPPPAPPREESMEPEVEVGFSDTTLQQLSANEMELESEEVGALHAGKRLCGRCRRDVCFGR